MESCTHLTLQPAERNVRETCPKKIGVTDFDRSGNRGDRRNISLASFGEGVNKTSSANGTKNVDPIFHRLNSNKLHALDRPEKSRGPRLSAGVLVNRKAEKSSAIISTATVSRSSNAG